MSFGVEMEICSKRALAIISHNSSSYDFDLDGDLDYINAGSNNYYGATFLLISLKIIITQNLILIFGLISYV